MRLTPELERMIREQSANLMDLYAQYDRRTDAEKQIHRAFSETFDASQDPTVRDHERFMQEYGGGAILDAIVELSRQRSEFRSAAPDVQ